MLVQHLVCVARNGGVTRFPQLAERFLSTSTCLYAEAKEAPAPPKGIPYSHLSIGVPKEIFQNEARVAISPQVILNLTKKGFTVNVEENAGVLAKFNNSELEAAGAKIGSKQDAFHSDIVLKVRTPL